MIFYRDYRTHCYESEGKWICCVQYLFNMWISQKENIPLFLKLSVNTWYTLTLDGPELKLSSSEIDFLAHMLSKAYKYFSSKLEKNVNCQWIFGYMMEVRPDLFFDTEFKYSEIENTGKLLIEKSSNYGSIFGNLLCTTSCQIKKEKRKCREKIKMNIPEYFDESQEVDRYFIEILTTDFM